jgi:uncharacterized protein (TIGR01244 family)
MHALRIISLIVLLSLTKHCAAQETAGQKTAAPQTAADAVTVAELGKTVNVHVCGNVFLAGQPTVEDIEAIKGKGVKRVISLRQDGEVDWDEAGTFEAAGLEFKSIPFAAPETLTDEVFSQVRELLQVSDRTPTLLHCGSANRVGAVWMVHRVLDQGVELDEALKEAKVVGLRNPAYEKKAIDFIKRSALSASTAKTSVRPGINENFLKSDLDVSEWIARFEIESREVYSARDEVIEAIGITPGLTVVDIGAGTGLYSRLFSQAVGPKGWVFAVDISPRFIEHINKQAVNDKLKNVTTVLCPDDSISLPSDSADVAFVCDTYHHFEYPAEILATIHTALRPGGKLIAIDFNRIPGVSREWTISHVRADKDTFRQEIEAARFQFVGEKKIEGFEENYFLEFRKQ